MYIYVIRNVSQWRKTTSTSFINTRSSEFHVFTRQLDSHQLKIVTNVQITTCIRRQIPRVPILLHFKIYIKIEMEEWRLYWDWTRISSKFFEVKSCPQKFRPQTRPFPYLYYNIYNINRRVSISTMSLP